MKIVVVDGQGGGIGRLLVEKLKARAPGHEVIAVGTNALATSAMLRAGADAGATGENAVRYNCRDADLILGPAGIILDDAMLGEVSPAMAEAVRQSPALVCLLPMAESLPGRRAPTLEGAAEALVEEALGEGTLGLCPRPR
ncbi:MAG: DUF3842 family protein [Oscillospiraceae bacterium]|nr:DUF3842 family protein [Oscillospiraceae bacterium]